MKRIEYCSKKQLDRLREVDKKYQRNKRASGLIDKTEEYRLWCKKHPGGALAQSKANRAIKKGIIKKRKCKLCKSKKVYAHHENYYKPLKIIWFCPSCHKKYHLGLVELKLTKLTK